MSNVREIQTEEHRYDEASAWIAKMDAGLSADAELELCRWMAIDAANAEVMMQMATLWDKMDDLARLSEVVPHSAFERVRSTPDRSMRAWYTVAASILVVVLAGLGGIALISLNDSTHTANISSSVYTSSYETAVGAQSTVDLPDGSKITLNTNSRVRVDYSVRQRRVYLERGELHIDVAHDVSRPLSVIAGDRVIRAVGTAFNVKINTADQIELVVTSGRVLVDVRAPADEPAIDTPAPATRAALAVAQGEKVTLGSPDEAVKPLAPEDIEVRLSWQQGNMIFRGVALGEAVAEINRYTSVEFVFLDEDLRSVRIAGLFKTGDVAGFLAALRTNFDITAERTDDDKILLKSAVVLAP